MTRLADRARDLRDRETGADRPAAAITTQVDSEPATGQPASNVLRKDGDYWTLAHSGTVVRLKDSKGLHYLAHLLRHPAQEFLALDVAVVGSEPSALGTDGRRARLTSTNTTPLLDSKAKAEYKLRLTELREELQEAEARNDIGRAERARMEIESLGQQLAAAVGLHGSDRLTASHAERARSTVTKGIKSAIAKIHAANPAAGRYLARTVRTGSFCAYEPDPDDRTEWTV